MGFLRHLFSVKSSTKAEEVKIEMQLLSLHFN